MESIKEGTIWSFCLFLKVGSQEKQLNDSSW
jgi:hypothetical protein